MEAATVEIDGAINSLTRSIATKMYRSGYGEIGQLSATAAVTGTTLTLSDPNEITNFEYGMELDLSATLTGALRAYGSSSNGLIITGVNRSAGTFTVGYNANDGTNGIPAIAASDYIFIRGDHVSGTQTTIAGLGAWVPASAPSSATFFGVDRSVDTRLGALRLDGSAYPIEEALIEAAVYAAREGAKIDYFFMNYANYSKVEKALGTKVQYIDMKVNPEIAFRGITVNGPRGTIRILPDQNCPPNTAFGVQLDTWKLYSLGKAVRVIDTDGLQMLRQASADGVEVRYGFYGNMGTRAPGYNINLKLA